MISPIAKGFGWAGKKLGSEMIHGIKLRRYNGVRYDARMGDLFEHNLSRLKEAYNAQEAGGPKDMKIGYIRLQWARLKAYGTAVFYEFPRAAFKKLFGKGETTGQAFQGNRTFIVPSSAAELR